MYLKEEVSKKKEVSKSASENESELRLLFFFFKDKPQIEFIMQMICEEGTFHLLFSI